MIKGFLSTNRYIKIRMLEELYVGPLDLKNFSKFFEISESTTKRYLNELSLELAEKELDISLKYINSNTCTLNHLISYKKHVIHTIEELKYQLLSVFSPTFQLCELLCQGDNITIKNIQEKLLVSRSQAYKVIKDINLILKPRNIHLAFSESKKIEFEGNELDIRLFIYHFITENIPKNRWFFKKISKNQIVSDLVIFISLNCYSEFTKEKLYVFFSILKSRLLLKKFTNIINKDWQNIFLRFSYFPFSKMKLYFLANRLTDNSILYSEYLYCNFFIRIFIPDVIPFDNIQLIGDYLNESNNSDHKLLVSLMDSWATTFNVSLSSETKNTILYNSGILSVLSFFVPNSITNFLDSLQIKNNYSSLDSKLITDILLLIEKKINSAELSNNRKQIFYEKGLENFVSFYYLSTSIYTNPKLNILLYFTREFTSELLIKSKIQNIYNPNIICFTDMAQQADVIITDNIERYPSNNASIFIIRSLTPEKMRGILLNIQNKIIQKSL